MDEVFKAAIAGVRSEISYWRWVFLVSYSLSGVLFALHWLGRPIEM